MAAVRDEAPPGDGPHHARIAGELIARITSGAYPVGSLLPTEHQLSDEFQRSRQTIREALRRLTDLQLVARQPGVGTRVLRQAPAAHYAYAINSLAELAEYAEESRLVIAGMRKVTVQGEQARVLECADGDRWHHLEGVRYRKADGVALGVSEIFLRDWFPGVQQHLAALQGATHEMLARHYGVTIDEVRQDARASLLTREQAKLLDAEAGAACMEVVRRYYERDGTLILSGRIVYPAERFSLAMRFRRAAGT